MGGSAVVLSDAVVMVRVSGPVCVVGIVFKICSSQQYVLMDSCGLADVFQQSRVCWKRLGFKYKNLKLVARNLKKVRKFTRE